MIVNVEIRDTRKLKSERRNILKPFIIYTVIEIASFIASVICPNYTAKSIALILFIASVLAFIPLTIILLIRAQKAYNNTWLTKEFDFYVKDTHLYLENKKLHVNYNKSVAEIYVHDMGDYKNPYKATFYGTIREPEVDMFLKFIKDNKVRIERQKFPRLKGKFGFLAPFIISKYRR